MEFVPVQMVDMKIAAKLDISDLDIPQKENIEPLLLFPVSAYDKLNKLKKETNLENISHNNWDDTFAIINHFFSTLSKEQQSEIVYAFALMHKDILDFFTDDRLIDLTILTRKLSVHCDSMDLSIGLCDKLREYALSNIPIGLMPNAGSRAQDDDKLTFYPDEVATVMSIALLCKMMAPIFGVMMSQLLNKIDIKTKESCCTMIFTNLFNRKFPKIIDKLKFYIRHTVDVQCGEDTTRALMHGCDNHTLSHTMYSQLLIRQFVNVPLIKKESNLITYILVSVKKALTTVYSTILKKPTYHRSLFLTSADDDGNTSRLEADSMVSSRTCDVPSLIKCAVPHTLNKYMRLYDISKEDLDNSLEYYSSNPISPTLLNKDMNSMFYSKDFGGGRGILMLKSSEYTQITALLQLVLFSLSADDGYRQLAHMLTVMPSLDTQAGFTFEDNQFRLNTGSSIGYKNCRMRFENSPFGLKGKEWDNHIDKITEDIIMHKYRYNTAPWLWDLMGLDNYNGKLVKPNGVIIAALCDFYDWLHGAMMV